MHGDGRWKRYARLAKSDSMHDRACGSSAAENQPPKVAIRFRSRRPPLGRAFCVPVHAPMITSCIIPEVSSILEEASPTSIVAEEGVGCLRHIRLLQEGHKQRKCYTKFHGEGHPHVHYRRSARDARWINAVHCRAACPSTPNGLCLVLVIAEKILRKGFRIELYYEACFLKGSESFNVSVLVLFHFFFFFAAVSHLSPQLVCYAGESSAK